MYYKGFHNKNPISFCEGVFISICKSVVSNCVATSQPIFKQSVSVVGCNDPELDCRTVVNRFCETATTTDAVEHCSSELLGSTTQ